MKQISKSRQRGAALMEFALCLPMLVLIIMLVLEGSRVVRTHQVLNNAAREGARLSVLPENQGLTADIANEVVTYAAENGVTIAPANVTVNQAVPITASGVTFTGSQVTVTSTYTVNYLAVFTWLGVPSTYSLTGQAVFRNFYSTL
jgi:Flp pilus assembly protein TadG